MQPKSRCLNVNKCKINYFYKQNEKLEIILFLDEKEQVYTCTKFFMDMCQQKYKSNLIILKLNSLELIYS
jgi:regulatory protein YycI of two-component signal transduction system YycFG